MAVDIIDTSSQWIHIKAMFLDSTTSCLVTFIYGLHEVSQRSVLWEFVRVTAREYRDTPWCCVGDMNMVRKPQ